MVVTPLDMAVTACLHVTSAGSVQSILTRGLIAHVGVMSVEAGESAGIFMFPTWESMVDANWLFDNWPDEEDPVLLMVNTSGLDLVSEVGYEVVSRTNIEPSRISVLATEEKEWNAAREKFLKAGGLAQEK